jgi:hypothetical protein
VKTPVTSPIKPARRKPDTAKSKSFPFWTIQPRAYGFALLLKLHSPPP